MEALPVLRQPEVQAAQPVSGVSGIEFVGGPLCGTRQARKSDPGLFTYSDGQRCFKQPGKNRLLFRRLEPHAEDESVLLYLHVDDRVGHCETCGCYSTFVGRRVCGMCQKELPAHSR